METRIIQTEYDKINKRTLDETREIRFLLWLFYSQIQIEKICNQTTAPGIPLDCKKGKANSSFED